MRRPRLPWLPFVLLVGACAPDRPGRPGADERTTSFAADTAPAAPTEPSAAMSASAVSGVDSGSSERLPDTSPESTSPEALFDAGLEAYYGAEFGLAERLFGLAEARARQVGDRATEARALTWRGLRAWKQWELEQARFLGEQALALKLEHGLEDQLFRSYNALGLTAWYESRLREAENRFRQAEAAAQAAGDPEGLATAAGNLGLIYWDYGEFQRARESFRTMAEAARRFGDPRKEGNALTNLASLEIDVGDPWAALPILARARELYRSVGYVDGEENVLGQLGTAHADLGRLDRARAAFDSALAIVRRDGRRGDEANILEQLAELYRELGDPRRALALYTRARSINEELGQVLLAGSDLRNEAEIHAGLGNLDEASRRVERALALHQKSGALPQLLADRLTAAEIAARRHRSDEVDRQLADARRLAASLGAGAPRVWLALAEARIAQARGRPERVLSVLAGVGEELEGRGYDEQWEAAALRARAFLRLDRLDSAVTAGSRAVELVERVRRGLDAGVLRTSYTAARTETYADLMLSLLRSGRVEEAFRLADAVRGRQVRAHLLRSGLRPRDDPRYRQLSVADELLRRFDRLSATRDSLEAWGATMELADIERRIADTRLAHEALVARQGAGESPDRSTLLVGGGVDPRAVAAALSPDEVVLEYFQAPDRLILFAVSRAGIRVAETPTAGDELASRVRLVRELLGRPGTEADAVRPLLEDLYRKLVEPAAHAGLLRDARRLLVVAGGALAYLPFPALIDPVTGRYLIEDRTLLHIPSADALWALRRLATEPSRDPSPGPSTVLVPFPDRLPGTRAEGRAARRALRHARLVQGARASEPQARDALEETGVVHFATHAAMNPRQPLASRIELAGGDGAPDDDGVLEVHEVLRLRVRAPLVFLSGCETGTGPAWSTAFAQGEDYATLSRAFLYAGARNVMATLWRLEDRGAARFGTLYYQALRELGLTSSGTGDAAGGAPLADALARAQRAMLSVAGYASPYYWAGYRISGVGR